MAFRVCLNMGRRGARGQQDENLAWDLAVRLAAAVCTDLMNEVVEDEVVLRQVHIGAGASWGRKRTACTEYLPCPSTTLSALLTMEGSVCLSLSSTCHLSSEQSGLDGGGRLSGSV